MVSGDAGFASSMIVMIAVDFAPFVIPVVLPISGAED
jgi:hypothetical protein